MHYTAVGYARRRVNQLLTLFSLNIEFVIMTIFIIHATLLVCITAGGAYCMLQQHTTKSLTQELKVQPAACSMGV